MNSLRTVVLMLAVAAISFSAQRCLAQQEVDPDHFDQPVAAKAVAKQTAPSVTTHHHSRGKANLASKHARQRHSHPA